MSGPSTCWHLLDQAAAGEVDARERFTQVYAVVVTDYLGARWRSRVARQDLDDAVQEVMIECLKEGGALEDARLELEGGFRPFLFGITRNVARRFEERAGRRIDKASPDTLSSAAHPPVEESASVEFDRAWARALVREARRHLEHAATTAGASAQKRLELLRLRFFDGLAIRDIAARWNLDASKVHHEYARARKEFRGALKDVIGFHNPGSDAQVERELVSLLQDLG